MKKLIVEIDSDQFEAFESFTQAVELLAHEIFSTVIVTSEEY